MHVKKIVCDTHNYLFDNLKLFAKRAMKISYINRFVCDTYNQGRSQESNIGGQV
jgi:uncharacterized protein YlaI